MPRLHVNVPQDVSLIIVLLLDREGGYVDDPDDPGGATNMGITQSTLDDWRGESADVWGLTTEEAIQIYYINYWKKLNLHYFDHHKRLQEFIFDWCVNGGLKSPARNIQRLVGAKKDGVIGPITASKINDFVKSSNGMNKIIDCRIRWYIRIGVRRHASIKFLLGWFNRANSFRYS